MRRGGVGGRAGKCRKEEVHGGGEERDDREREKKQPGRERKNHTAIELIRGKIVFVRGLL